jgi:hypothetical protein
MCAGGGPEVQIDPGLLIVFRRCFLDALVPFLRIKLTGWSMDDTMLSRCEPTVWLDVATHLESQGWPPGYPERILYIYVHINVSPSGSLWQHIDLYSVPFLSSVQSGLQTMEAGNLEPSGGRLATRSLELV